MPNKEDKYVYITGCDTGFGSLLAKHLDQLGFRVIAGCYTEKGEDELKKISSDRLTTIQLDVSDSASVSKAAAHVKTLVGQKGRWLCGFCVLTQLDFYILETLFPFQVFQSLLCWIIFINYHE